MTNLEILKAFELEISKSDNLEEKPITDDSLYWLNQAANKFVKLRFNGDFTHKTGYEQTEKRRSDLKNLFVSVDFAKVFIINDNKNFLVNNNDEYIILYKNTASDIDTTNSDYNTYHILYPNDFMFALNEDVVISDTDGNHVMNTCVFECTQDSFMYRINNSLTDFHYRFHRARPIRTRTSTGCILYTDKNYNIIKYTLGYIKQPSEITLDKPNEEYSDFDNPTIYEIVKIAALMYLENKKDERYQTITAEVMSQE